MGITTPAVLPVPAPLKVCVYEVVPSENWVSVLDAAASGAMLAASMSQTSMKGTLARELFSLNMAGHSVTVKMSI
jgi:hypothetical protein